MQGVARKALPRATLGQPARGVGADHRPRTGQEACERRGGPGEPGSGRR